MLKKFSSGDYIVYVNGISQTSCGRVFQVVGSNSDRIYMLSEKGQEIDLALHIVNIWFELLSDFLTEKEMFTYIMTGTPPDDLKRRVLNARTVLR